MILLLKHFINNAVSRLIYLGTICLSKSINSAKSYIYDSSTNNQTASVSISKISLQRQGDSSVRDTIVKNAATQAALDLMGTYKKSGGGQPTGNKVILIESVKGDRSRI